MRARDRIANRVAGSVPVKAHLLRNGTGVISFTFDDVPRSALSAAGAILSKHGCAGTYYIAGGLTGEDENGVPCHTVEDLRAAARDGHELASHGFAHVPYPRLNEAARGDDVARNARFFEDALQADAPCHFSYPLGARSPGIKTFLARRFMTARGIRPGINRRICDLADLRANALYSRTMDERKVSRLIAAAAARAHWLIFYTHDVSSGPTRFGTTPALVDFAVREAVASGCRVLPIRNAIGAVSYP